MNIQEVKKLGIVGAGGAGFPTYIKLKARPECVILNGAECEPLLHKDKELLLHHTDVVLKGLKKVMEFTGARQGIIGLKEKYQELIDCLSQKIEPPIRIEPVGDFYPVGDEIILVYLTTGRIVQPGQLPISVGCLVQNVETVYNIGLNQPVVDKFLTIAGEVEHPLTIKVPIGTSFTDILKHFTINSSKTAIFSGGLMMGKLVNDTNQVVDKTTNGLILLPENHHCVTTYHRYSESRETVRTARAACDQCSFCTDLCPRYLIGYPVRPEMAMRNRMFSQDNNGAYQSGNAFCCECNVCTLYACPEGLDPRGSTIIEKRLAHQAENKWEGLPVQIHPMQDYRRVPTSKLMQRLDVLSYSNKAPLQDISIQPDQVRIPLKQHIGSPAKSVVKKGDRVNRLDLIGEATGDVSSPVHASIDGQVTEVNAHEIIIQR